MDSNVSVYIVSDMLGFHNSGFASMAISSLMQEQVRFNTFPLKPGVACLKVFFNFDISGIYLTANGRKNVLEYDVPGQQLSLAWSEESCRLGSLLTFEQDRLPAIHTQFIIRGLNTVGSCHQLYVNKLLEQIIYG